MKRLNKHAPSPHPCISPQCHPRVVDISSHSVWQLIAAYRVPYLTAYQHSLVQCGQSHSLIDRQATTGPQVPAPHRQMLIQMN